jgi:hypothetical protein
MPTSPWSSRSRALQIGVLLSLVAIAGLWLSAARAERALRDQLDGALARQAAAYLLVVTPFAADGSVDAPRLVSAANTIASSSFWPGGFQMAVGSAPLVTDSIGLLPLPDSALAALERQTPFVVTTHARHRVIVVPMPQGPGAQGWAAAWGALPSRLPSALTGFCTVLALGAMGAALLLLRREREARWRPLSLLVAMGCFAMVTIALGANVRRTARTATSLHLRTTRRLVEIAATAVGVKQARLPEIAAGLEVREAEGPIPPGDDIVHVEGPKGPVARIVAATPRSQRGLEISVTPAEARLGPFYRSILLWFLLGMVGFGVTGWAAGLSGLAGLFHSAGEETARRSEGGSGS